MTRYTSLPDAEKDTSPLAVEHMLMQLGVKVAGRITPSEQFILDAPELAKLVQAVISAKES